jgi:DNA-binding MarR family transcriptional regulator
MTGPAPISDLTDHLGFWLRAVSNHVSQAFAARLAGRGVTVAEWVVLRALYGRAARSPSRLAEEIGLTRGAITRLADRLIAKALVVRKASEVDGRAQTLALTAKGLALTPELAALADGNDAEFFGLLTGAERTVLRALLERMVQQGQMLATPVD